MKHADPAEAKFSKRLKDYAAIHWAWPAIILLGWAFRRYRDSNEWVQGVLFVSIGIVIVVGWRQVATDSYWRTKWTIFLIFVLLFVSIYLIPLVFILLPFVLIWLVIDLFFIAPRQP